MQEPCALGRPAGLRDSSLRLGRSEPLHSPPPGSFLFYYNLTAVNKNKIKTVVLMDVVGSV